MDKIQLNNYVPRDAEIQFIKDVLTSWDQDKDAASKKSIYVYGHPGSGKTTLINNTLKALNYDIVKLYSTL